MSAEDQLEREVEDFLARAANRAVPDSHRAPAPPWRQRRRRIDARRFGRATPWLVAAVLLVIAGLGIGAAVGFDAGGPDRRAPVGTEPPRPTASITAPDGTLGTPISTTPTSRPTLSRDSNVAAPDDSESPAAEVSVYANCNDPSHDAPAVRPVDIGLACADNGENLGELQWSSWTTTGATGTGTLEYRTCDPDCATGTQVHHVPNVSVILSGRVSGPDGVPVWTRLALSPDPVGGGSYSLPVRP